MFVLQRVQSDARDSCSNCRSTTMDLPARRYSRNLRSHEKLSNVLKVWSSADYCDPEERWDLASSTSHLFSSDRAANWYRRLFEERSHPHLDSPASYSAWNIPWYSIVLFNCNGKIQVFFSWFTTTMLRSDNTLSDDRIRIKFVSAIIMQRI